MGKQMFSYVVRQGDYLAKLAHRHGFDVDEVWNDPENDEIRELRTDHHILAPGDIVHLPAIPKEGLPLVKGAVNRYVAKVPKVPVHLQFRDGDGPLSGRAFTVEGNAIPNEGTTDAETHVRFVEVDTKGDRTYDIKVYRWSHPDFGGGDVDAKCNVRGSSVQFDEEAVGRISMVHESGHMIGLGDEYPDGKGKQTPALHSDLVYDDFGHEVIRGQVDPYRLMYSRERGHEIDQEYGVVFAYALRAVTQKSWRFHR